ncbi:MAG: stage sporulation protein [Frankiaceae bacterium]|nr:stage sporulation protein [Frankiaceae bacterium]
MRFRARTTVLALGALLTGLVVAAPAAPAGTVDEVYERPADGVYVVDGHGWGHGRGMSQDGALGAAGAGIGFTQILDTYYPGTLQSATATGNIRTLLSSDDGVDTQVAATAGLAVTDVPSGGHWVLPTSATITRWRFALAADGTLRVQSFDGTTWTSYAPGGIAGFGGPLQFDGGPIQLYLPGNTRRDYRGTMRAARTSTTTLVSINVASVEDYLKGVVPRESPSWFPAEALKAQAVAARSYSVWKRDNAGTGAQWDICDSTQCQVYGGQRLYQSNGTVVELEQPSTNAAVDATAAIMRTYNGLAIFAEFSSSNGGWSVSGAPAPYLPARADPWDGLDARNTNHTWTASVPVTAIEAAFPSVGRLARVRVTSRDGNGEWGGRVLGVVLEGTTAAGAATSVSTDGQAFYTAFAWPGNSAGMRSRWWHIRPVYDASVAVITADPKLVRTPAANSPSYVDLVNTGMTVWDPAALHFAVAGKVGSADPYTGGDTTPGGFVVNLTTGDASAVQPGQSARLQLPWNIGALAAGTYTAAYRLMHGTSQFGPPLDWQLTVVEPVFRASVAALPTTGPAGATPAFAPQPVGADGTVAVARTGHTSVRLLFKNSSNLAWPVGGVVRLGTSAPRNRLSPSAGTGWVSRNRPAKVSGVLEDAAATSVAPGQTAIVDATIFGNNRPAGTTTETFELVWEKQTWIPGSTIALRIARVDTTVSRVAELVTAPSAAVRLVDFPRGTTTLTVRLRNLGANTWRVGGSDVMGLTTPAGAALRMPAWLSPTRTTRLGKGFGGADGLVYPGEVGEWLVPISAFRKGARVVTPSLRPVNMASRVFYGPTTTSAVTIVPGVLSGSVVQVTQNAVVPRAANRVVFFDVRNTSNFAWPVGSAVRTAALRKGGSPSRDASWLSPTRPGAISFNATRKGARDVRPGEVARLSFRIAGNNRAAGVYTEPFGILWDGWRSVGAPIVLRYILK